MVVLGGGAMHVLTGWLTGRFTARAAHIYMGMQPVARWPGPKHGILAQHGPVSSGPGLAWPDI
jgi:hypothetical protein